MEATTPPNPSTDAVDGEASPDTQNTVGTGALSSFPEFDLALEANNVSFPQVAAAEVFSRARFQPDPELRATYERYYPQLMQAFVARYGDIEAKYTCEDVIASVVLTCRSETKKFLKLFERTVKRPSFFSVKNSSLEPTNLHVGEILDECDELAVSTDQMLAGRDREICMAKVYDVGSSLMTILDLSSVEQPDVHNEDKYAKLIGTQKKRLAKAKEYFSRSARRKAQFEYLSGMSMAIPVLVGLGALLSWGIGSLKGGDLNRLSLTSSFVAGAVGAVASVMSRMSFQRPSVNYEARRVALMVAGAFRPFIGAVFGVVLCVFLAGGLLAVQVPSEAAKQLYFYIGVAFLGGFSERFAQDMLVTTRRRLSPSRDQADSEPQASPEPQSTS